MAGKLTARLDDLKGSLERLSPRERMMIGGLGATQTGYAARGGITVGARLADGFHQFVENMLRRRQIRVAHTEVDDVGAVSSRAGLQPIDLFKHIGRQAPDLVKVVHCPTSHCSSQNPNSLLALPRRIR